MTPSLSIEQLLRPGHLEELAIRQGWAQKWFSWLRTGSSKMQRQLDPKVLTPGNDGKVSLGLLRAVDELFPGAAIIEL